jgi:hypothetical protein
MSVAYEVNGSDIVAHPPTVGLVVHGFSISETAATAATAEAIIRHGQTDTSPPLTAPINAAADGYGMWEFPGGPINCPNGVYLDQVSGKMGIVLYVDYECR